MVVFPETSEKHQTQRDSPQNTGPESSNWQGHRNEAEDSHSTERRSQDGALGQRGDVGVKTWSLITSPV